MKERDSLMRTDAIRAINYDAKFRLGGGYDLKHKPCSCGIVLKWLLGIKKITYSTFAKQLNNTTAQNLNYLINRVDKSRFYEEDIERMCKILKVKKEYFDGVCSAVEEIMEIRDGETGR